MSAVRDSGRDGGRDQPGPAQQVRPHGSDSGPYDGLIHDYKMSKINSTKSSHYTLP